MYLKGQRFLSFLPKYTAWFIDNSGFEWHDLVIRLSCISVSVLVSFIVLGKHLLVLFQGTLQVLTYPPSTAITAPVTNSARSDARKTMVGTTSLQVPM